MLPSGRAVHTICGMASASWRNRCSLSRRASCGTLLVADVGGDAADGVGGAVCARQQELDRQGGYGRAGVRERLLVDAGAAGRQEVGVVPGKADGDLRREQVCVVCAPGGRRRPARKLTQGFVRQ